MREIEVLKMKLRSNFKAERTSNHLRTMNQTKTSAPRTAIEKSRPNKEQTKSQIHRPSCLCLEPMEIQSQSLGSKSHSEEFRNEMLELNFLSSELMLDLSIPPAFENMQ